MNPFRHIGGAGLALLLLFAPLAGSAQDQGTAQQQGQNKQAQQKSKTLQGKLVAIPRYVQQAQGQQGQQGQKSPQGSMQGQSSPGQGPFGLVVTEESFLSKISPGEDEQLYLLVFRQGMGSPQGMGSDSPEEDMGSPEEDEGMGSASGHGQQQARQWLNQKVSVRGTHHEKAGLQVLVVEQISPVSTAGAGSQSKGSEDQSE